MKGAGNMKEKTHRSLLNLPPKTPAQLLDAVARDTVDHGLAVGHNKSHIITVHERSDEAASAELVHLLVRLAVEVERDAVALVPRLLAPPQHRRVVAAHLGAACAVGRRAVKVGHDERLDGVGAVVDARRDDEHGKNILLGRVQAELRRAAVDLRADVHGGARLVGRDELGVEGDGGLDGVQEQVRRHGRDAYELGAVLEARRVAVRPEDGDAVVAGQAEGLEAFVGLLAVV